MSKHFHAHQYDLPFRPTYLRNWEIPKNYCPKPRQRIGSTKLIANSRGQLLPGVLRPPCNPFGDFIGTWSLPKKITREVANELNGSAHKKAFLNRCAQGAAMVPKPKYTKAETMAELENQEQNEEKRKSQESEEGYGMSQESSQVKKVICPIHDF